jgi:hypothetical protein
MPQQAMFAAGEGKRESNQVRKKQNNLTSKKTRMPSRLVQTAMMKKTLLNIVGVRETAFVCWCDG